jgi:hypothetical protein
MEPNQVPAGKVAGEEAAVVKGFPLSSLQCNNIDISVVKGLPYVLGGEKNRPASR